MSRFDSFFNHLSRLAARTRPTVYMDVGSAQTRVMIDNKVVWNQATAIAWHQDQSAVIAIGDKAAQLLGKTSHQVEVLLPIRQGVAADLPATAVFFEALLQQLLPRSSLMSVSQAHCWLAVPAEISKVEQQQLQSVLHNNGCSVDFVTSLEAIVHIPKLRKLNKPHAVLDCGAQTTELGLFSGQEPVVMKTMTDVTGEAFINAVMQDVKKAYDCEIGAETAQKILQQIGTALFNEKSMQQKMTIRGKDTRSGTVITPWIEAGVFKESFEKLIGQLVTDIKDIFVMNSPELLSQVLEQGIYITGGVSQLTNFSTCLAQHLETQVSVSSTPETDAVQGLVAMKQR